MSIWLAAERRLLRLTGVSTGILLVGAALAGAAGCHSADPRLPRQTVSQGDAKPQGDTKTFPIRGKVVSVDAAKNSVVLDHEAVPGFMDAMTMSYPLVDSAALGELHPGDRISARLLVRKTAQGFEGARLDEVVITAQEKPDYKPTVQYHVPAAGDVVPDFKLLNQSGRTIHLEQFRGRVLLLTFIYTRCPLADYCPRMSRNFADVDKALKVDPAVYAKTHLLSISFDPAYDTPQVLKSYGGAYTGEYTKATFSHWDFAAPPRAELDALTQWFDVGIQPMSGAGTTHSLSTVLIGKDGRVLAWYPTNEWTPIEVIAAIKAAA